MNEKLNIIRKYNLWNGNKMPSGINRPLYLKKISQFIGNKLIKVLVGQRRAGKSFILRQILNQLIDNNVSPENTLFISKEFIEYNFINDATTLEDLFQCYLSTLKPQGKIYIFIDEIQNINEWEKFVNSHSQDFTSDIEFFISGSNSRMLSSELATLLSGRYIEFNIYPYSYEEYTTVTNTDISRNSYINYLKDGGLPGLFDLNSVEAKTQYISSVKDTVMLRDIIQRKNKNSNETAIRDAKLLDDLYIYIINNASNPISIQNIVKYFKNRQRKVAYETIANYIRHIEETFLIHPAMQYNIKGKAASEMPYKYYSNDLSFKNYLYPGIAYGMGYLLENAIFLELKRNGFNVYQGTIMNREIDFVAIKGDRKIYVQCSYLIDDDDTRKREYASLLAIDDNFEKWVVTLDELQYPIYEGIRHIQAWNLKNEF